VDDVEQLTYQLTQAFAVRLVRGSRQRGQELDVPNQVCQAELDHDVTRTHVTPIGTEAIAAQYASKVLPQDLHQHISTAPGIDVVQHVQFGPETPRPPALAVVLVAGLVHVEAGLPRQRRPTGTTR
jgi:hypothetical protein